MIIQGNYTNSVKSSSVTHTKLLKTSLCKINEIKVILKKYENRVTSHSKLHFQWILIIQPEWLKF